MLLLKHMFYNKIRGRRKRFFMCPLERVAWETSFTLTTLPSCPSHSPSLTLGMLHLWMVILAIQLPRTISHSSCSRSSFSAGCLGKYVQRFLMCLTFVVCETSGRGREKEVRVSKLRKCDVHRISHLTVCVWSTFNSAHTLIHQSPVKSTSLIKPRRDFLWQILNAPSLGKGVGGGGMALLGLDSNNRKLNLMSNVSLRETRSRNFLINAK